MSLELASLPLLFAVSSTITAFGTIEGSYSYNFNRPQNRITNFRAFNSRHQTMTLENVVLGAQFNAGPVAGKLALQIGAAPSTYYLAEPVWAGSSAVNATGPDLWKYLQEANVSWKAPIGDGLLLQAGLFASPIGLEVFAIKDNWNWSRSNLFFGLPFYHTGIRGTYAFDEHLSATFAAFNGWNSVVDNNSEKSISANISYAEAGFCAVQLLYFGGVERAEDSPEGSPWRHDFDLYATIEVTERLSFGAQANAGFESTHFGRASWLAGAIYARLRIFDVLYLALRVDRFSEKVPGAASPIFWAGAKWVSSGTATLDIRPAEQLLVRVEYRHDAASAPLYFGRNDSAEPGATAQNTMTAGITSWF